MSYFKGKWSGDVVIIEKDSGAENECQMLAKLLKKNCHSENDLLEAEFESNEKNNLQFLFYSSSKMKETYLKNSDIVFVNKRFP